MQNLCKIFIVKLLVICLSSCNTNTEVSYRENESQEYSKQDGYMFSCFVDGEKLIVETYTPESWGSEFYYDYLEGRKSKRKVTIINAKIRFISIGEAPNLKEFKKEGQFVYKFKNFEEIIEDNDQLKLIIFLKNDNDSKIIKKTFILNKYEDTYVTSTFPHA